MSRLKRKFELIIIMIIALIFIGCMNDMQHQGNWSSPVIEKDVIIVPSNEGKIHKYFISQNSFDLVNKYPQADIKIGSFYGDISIVDGVAYGISYGSDEGDKCQNKSCISYKICSRFCQLYKWLFRYWYYRQASKMQIYILYWW